MIARLSPLLAALAAGAVLAPNAAADTLLVDDPSASNVTAYGATSAWSRKATDGTYRLVVRNDGQVADAPVPPSPQPYDPDLGPTSANRRVIVYARGGDLCRYDVGSAAEQRIAALSSGATERAPSFFKESIAFSRTDGPRPGWYLARPGRPLTRLSTDAPLETDLAATRVAARFFGGARSIIRQSSYGGDDVRPIARAHAGEKVSGPTLTRFNVYWIRDLARSPEVRAEYVGVNAHRGLQPRVADRAFPTATSMATSKIPLLYTSALGVMTVTPKLRFH
jgi:hypothetical protein